ncbi:MAG TPA: hypothetical protein VJU15_12765 [Gemmatimonadales bacterium]|nr:hypothetical protein [Gemmatimonadales bacterium]
MLGVVRYYNRRRQRVAVSTDEGFTLFVVVAGPWPRAGWTVEGELTLPGHSTLRVSDDDSTMEVHVEASGLSADEAMRLTR